MPKLKSEVWTNAAGKRFVVLPEYDFARIAEMLEDRGLSRILREAKHGNTDKPGVPYAEVKRQLAARSRGKAITGK